MRELRAALGPSMAAKVRSGAELLRSAANSGQTTMIPTMLETVDALLGGGLQRGKLVELVSRFASGRFSIVLSTLAAATTMGEAAALIDLGDHFDPQLAEESGVDLRRLLWVRPRTVKEAVMSAEPVLRRASNAHISAWTALEARVVRKFCAQRKGSTRPT